MPFWGPKFDLYGPFFQPFLWCRRVQLVCEGLVVYHSHIFHNVHVIHSWFNALDRWYLYNLQAHVVPWWLRWLIRDFVALVFFLSYSFAYNLTYEPVMPIQCVFGAWGKLALEAFKANKREACKDFKFETSSAPIETSHHQWPQHVLMVGCWLEMRILRLWVVRQWVVNVEHRRQDWEPVIGNWEIRYSWEEPKKMSHRHCDWDERKNRRLRRQQWRGHHEIDWSGKHEANRRWQQRNTISQTKKKKKMALTMVGLRKWWDFNRRGN